MPHRSSHIPFLTTFAPAPIAARLTRALAGVVLGTALGLGVGLGVVVYEARFENKFLESTDDIIGWRAVPIPAGLIAGGIVGWTAPALLVGGGVGGIVGGAAGAAAGAAVGAVVSNERSGPWAGGCGAATTYR